MKRLTILGIIACAGLLVGSASVIGGPAGPPGGLEVNVINPVPLPVTVSGDVTGTISGEVEVTNDPLKVELDATHPREFINVPAQGAHAGDEIEHVTLYVVPNDKIYVLETISLMLQISEPAKPRRTDVNQLYIPLNYVSTFTNPLGDDVSEYVGCEQVRAYFGPGSTVALSFGVTHSDGWANYEIKLSGYLIDADSPSLSP